jgi:hypothetical protein
MADGKSMNVSWTDAPNDIKALNFSFQHNTLP